KGFGKRRIVQELYKKGIDREIIDEVTEELEFCSDDLCDILERKYGKYLDTEKGINRAFNGLVRMGYSYGEIKQALEERSSRADEDEFLKEDNENE
ncbi:MAG: regulatory protein RecX, partial [Acutalibacteraceae bacterium]